VLAVAEFVDLVAGGQQLRAPDQLVECVEVVERVRARARARRLRRPNLLDTCMAMRATRESLAGASYRARRALELITASPAAKTNAAVGSGIGGEDETDSDTKSPIFLPSALT